MSDTVPSRLELLQFARRVVIQQARASLEQLDRWIAEEERREAERRRGGESEPTPPEWLVEHGLNRRNVVAVHAGDCWTIRKSGRCAPVSRPQALEALRQQVPACSQCRPDTLLGFLE
ncbi:DUF6233 domain-containing protein [Streptomyces sp. NPDC055692]|uniref:DUF6233 domain-containing protein n=1 Tax=Streptomyces sp. NPDC055692 TaxID=3155683 RepID=UPI003428CE53